MADVLLVEDNPQSRKLARLLLGMEGHTVYEAGTVAQATRLAHEHTITLALVDIRLPDGRGEDVLRELRRRPEHIPVIAMTAYALRGDRDRFLKAGFDGYLSKPLDVSAFGRSIAAYVA